MSSEHHEVGNLISESVNETITESEVAEARATRHRAVMSARVQLLAVIRRDSKYFGQTAPDLQFPISIQKDCCGYEIIGGPGGRYRRQDVHVFAALAGVMVQLS